MARDEVVFLLTDGTALTVPGAELHLVYEQLWGYADRAGAISTAALLIEEARKHPSHRQPVQLNPKQTVVLRRAIARFANLS